MSPEDYRRLKTLDWIVPPARPAFDRLIAYASSQGFQPYIVSAVRKCSEQGPQSKTSRSWHVLGRAVDVELHARGALATIEDAYTALGAWWETEGGTWGGRWTELYPVPHPEGWCGPPAMAGDPCHFQFTDGREGVPLELWPRALTACSDVDQLQASYLASQAAGAPGGPILTPPGGSGLSVSAGRLARPILAGAVLLGFAATLLRRRR